MKISNWSTLLILAVAVLTFAIYVYTAAPSYTWAHSGADGGDLITASVTGGIPHPPGYPTYLLLTMPLRYLPLGELGHRFNLFSGLSAAIAVALTGYSVSRLLKRVSPLLPRWQGAVAAATAAALAFSSTLWSQAVITEVYALNAAFAAAIVALLLCWREAVGQRQTGRARAILAGLGLVFGLGLGNHLSLLLLGPGLLYWLWEQRRSPAFSRRSVALALLATLVGLLVYALLPFRAANGSIVNWGDPRTPQRFWWLVSGRLYEGFLFALPQVYVLPRLAAWARELLSQFGVWGVALALLGGWYLYIEDRPAARFVLIGLVLYSLYAIGYDTSDSYVYLIPAWLLLALLLGRGLAAAVELLLTAARPGQQARSALTVALLALLPLLSLGLHFGQSNLHNDREATEFRQAAMAEAGPNAIIITEADRPTFALWYHRYALELRPDVAVINAGLYTFDWYRETLAAHHPDLGVVLPDGTHRSLDDLVQANTAAGRPIYRAEAERSAGAAYPLQELP